MMDCYVCFPENILCVSHEYTTSYIEIHNKRHVECNECEKYDISQIPTFVSHLTLLGGTV